MLRADSSGRDPKIRVESWVGAEDTVSCTRTGWATCLERARPGAGRPQPAAVSTPIAALGNLAVSTATVIPGSALLPPLTNCMAKVGVGRARGAAMLTSSTPRPASGPEAAAPSSLGSGAPQSDKEGSNRVSGPLKPAKATLCTWGQLPNLPGQAEGGPFSSLSQPGTQTPPHPGERPPAPGRPGVQAAHVPQGMRPEGSEVALAPQAPGPTPTTGEDAPAAHKGPAC